MLKKHRLVPWWVAVLLLVGGMFFGSLADDMLPARGAAAARWPHRWRVAEEAYQLLQENFVEPDICEEAARAGAARGVLESVGDPYTRYVSAEDYEEWEVHLKGRYSGIGAYIGERDGLFYIVEPMPDSPAQKAGLVKEDCLVEVDGQATYGMSMERLLKMIRGPAGSVVNLTVVRKGEATRRQFSIVRATIQVPTVDHRMLGEGIAYLRLRYFNENATTELRTALAQLEKQGMRALVLDLRNNEGGYLDQARSVAGFFLGDGTVAQVVDREGNVRKLPVEPARRVYDCPLVVLVNRWTASASEIVAGALQDRKVAVLLGETTFGKAAISVPFKLSNGARAVITVERYLTPAGRDIHGQGIEPDIRVELSYEDARRDKDPQLDEAVTYLRARLK